MTRNATEAVEQVVGAGAGEARYEAALPLAAIVESPNNPRKRFTGMEELTKSIREQGIVTPLLVRPKGDFYEVAAGHRRRRAAIDAGRETVPAMVREMSDPQFLELLVFENDHRKDVHPLEEAAGYMELLSLRGYDVVRIADRLGRSPTHVYDRLKLLKLTPAAQKLFLEERFTTRHAILLARLKPEDQERAIEIGNGRSHRLSGLFTDVVGLPFDEELEKAETEDPYISVKAVSVREFEAWIQDDVRLEPEHVDAFLFPESAQAIEAHADARLGVILITREHRASDEVRGAGKAKVFGRQSWERADGNEKSKTCEWSRLGLVACGPGQGETFLVCINREKCAVHWAAWQKARPKRQATAAGGEGASRAVSSDERWKIEQKQRQEEEARYDAERKRWEKARPHLMKALSDKDTAAPTKAGGLLAKIVMDAIDDGRGHIAKEASKYVAGGKTAEDVLRAAAFIVLTREVHNYRAHQELPKIAKAFGVDARKVVDEVVPPEPPPVQTPAKPTGAAKKGKKKARR